MLKKKFANKPEVEIGEQIHIAVNLSLNKFLCTEDKKGKLPTGMTGW